MRCLIAIVMVLAASLSAVAQSGRAISSRETMQIDEQPGYVPSPEQERLPAVYQRQMVFFRSTEAPGSVANVNDVRDIGFDQIENEIIAKYPTANAAALMAGNKRKRQSIVADLHRTDAEFTYRLSRP